jgi:hypothetical protein
VAAKRPSKDARYEAVPPSPFEARFAGALG